MSGVRVLVGTRKGAFILTSDGKRQWESAGRISRAGRFIISRVRVWIPIGSTRRRRAAGSGKSSNAPMTAAKRGHPERRPASRPPRRRHAQGREQQVRLRVAANRRTSDTHQWYDGTQHPWEFKRVWHLEPSLTDPDIVYAGVEDAALFRSTDGGKTWQEFPGLRGTAQGPGSPAPAACACTPSFSIRSNPNRIFVAISAAGAFRTDDGGKTWQPINRGLKSQYIPDPTAEVGHCVHRIAMHPSRPDVLFMQKHWDVMRSDNAGDPGTRSAAICRPISASPSTCMPTSRRPFTSSRSRAIPSISRPTASCACTAAGPAATNGRR